MTNEAKCNCQRCGQHIAFPPEMAGQDVACPHCERETTLLLSQVRKAYPESVLTENSAAEKPVEESTIVCCYVLSVLLPIVGFFCGIWLMAKKQSGHGAACMAVSIFCFLIALAIFSQM